MSIEKFLNAFEKFDRFMNKEPAPSTAPKNPSLRISQITITPIDVFAKHLKQFLTLGALFALIMSVLSFSTGNSAGCDFKLPDGVYPYRCVISEAAEHIMFLLLRLLVIVVFIKSWCRIAFTEDKKIRGEDFVISTRDWKLYITLILFLLINSLPVISLMILIQRVPNPDWRIESLYFAVVSCGFWLPILAIRWYSLPAFIIMGQKVPSFLTFFERTRGNTLKILVSLFFIILCFSVITLLCTGGLKEILPYNYLLMGIVCDYLYNIMILIVAALLSCYIICMQQEVFAHEEER